MNTSEILKRAIDDDSYLLKEFDKAADIATFYGFSPIKTPRFEKVDRDTALRILDESVAEQVHELSPNIFEQAAMFRACEKWQMLSRSYPQMIYFRRPLLGASSKKSLDEFQCALHIIGSASAICEAIAIKAATAILKEHGHGETYININSLGDRDSIGRFERELHTYLKKISPSIPSELKIHLRKNPYEIGRLTDEGLKDVKEQAPKSISCLSGQSIEHFKEVLEHIESMSIPYRINYNLLGHGGFCSHTIFEIREVAQKKDDGLDTPPPPTPTTDRLLVSGSRHNHISKKFGYKKDIPILSVHLKFNRPEAKTRLIIKKRGSPKFYFIQFGSRAKLKSLSVIETLRQARIHVHHSLTKDKLVGQITTAETSSVPFVIIMGQKEALDNTVVVRHMNTRVQQTVPISDLPRYLLKLKI